MLLGLALASICLAPPARVLVFTRTEGFRHDSIPEAIEAIRKLAAERKFEADFTEDPAAFQGDLAKKYRAVAFVLTTGDVLDPPQQEALRSFVEGGGGFVGVHSASDTEYDWEWYGGVVGAYFASHPAIHEATLHVERPDHPTVKGLPNPWVRTDEWYDFRSNPRGKVDVLLTVDERTYPGGKMGADHPITWCKNVGRGRAFYTGLGHTKTSYSEPAFLSMLGNALEWSWGR